jgi:hypothetical protein
MTSSKRSDLLDTRIEQMLRRRAGTGAPGDLADAIAGAVAGTVQRPTSIGRWRTRGRWGSRTLLVAAALMVTSGAIGILLVGGGFINGPRRPPTSDLAVPPPASQGPETSTVPVPSTSPASPAPTVSAAFFETAAFDPTLVTDMIGWVSTPTSVYRTTDSGRTWTDTRPPSAGSPQPLVVVNETTAAIASGEGSSASISITHDGGRSWSTASIRGITGGGTPLLLFRSPTNATATIFDTIDASPASLRVYVTTDGGGTWQGPVSVRLPAQQSKLAGWANGMMWLNRGKADNVPFDERLWLSTDGGATWTSRRFPTPAFAPAGSLKWVIGPPVLQPAGRIVIAISDGGQAGLFSSADGQTWRSLGSWMDASPSGYTFEPIDAMNWLLTNDEGTQVLSTVDGGSHWRMVRGDHLIYFLNQSFANPDHGWAYHACDRNPAPLIDRGPDPFCDGNDLASVFLETTNGGKTWAPLGR